MKLLSRSIVLIAQIFFFLKGLKASVIIFFGYYLIYTEISR